MEQTYYSYIHPPLRRSPPAAAFDLGRFLAEAGLPENLQDTLEVQGRLQPDEAIASWLANLKTKLAGGGRYWDLCCALNLISRRVRPRRYLEIGVRRGRSMAQIAARNPQCEIAGFDLWVSPYAGVENPGPDFVRREIRAAGHAGTVRLISGPSRETVPRFLSDHPGAAFDVITVDGDHSEEGAWADLEAVAPRVRPGGFLLFDDLLNPHHSLYPVWRRFRILYRDRFQFAENLKDHWGTGVARRCP
jgi:predicted O-methyltransferase YrrM